MYRRDYRTLPVNCGVSPLCPWAICLYLSTRTRMSSFSADRSVIA